MKTEIVSPCVSIPEDAASARLIGLYPQRQEGLWMQRIRVPGGALVQDQWHALADAAREFTPLTPLHLTTRQDVEFHDLPPDEVPRLQAFLGEEGLSGLGACGDTLRNVTVCPCSGLRAGCPDLGPLGLDILHLLHEQDGIFALPRKFKISLSACPEGCAQPYINDLSFVAKRRGDGWTFNVIAAGSLGPRPATGIPLIADIPPEDVLPLVLATVRVFAAHGDREHRGRARLRHVRERLGDAAFTELLLDAFRRVKAERSWPEMTLLPAAGEFRAKLTLQFANGDLSPNAADALGSLTGDESLRVRIANHHEVHVFGSNGDLLRRRILAEPSLTDALRPSARVVACPGTRWCSRGITDADGLGERIRRELKDILPPGTFVGISGCPNGCAQGAVADFGLVGGLSTRDGKRVEVWTLLAAGGGGRDGRLATEVARGLTADEVISGIRRRLGHAVP
jgi:sulfite reductase beta subunit-like hemoprotein